MSHELLINEETGDASIIYTGEIPWHGYGIKWEKGEPLTATRATELIHSDYEIAKTQNISLRPDDEWTNVNSYTLWRPPLPHYGISDWLEINGGVGEDYTLLQTREIAELLDEPIEIEGEAKAITDFWPILTHGVISNGVRVFFSLSAGSFNVKEGRKKEQVNRVVSLLDDKNARGAVKVTVGGIVVVCWNTWQMAESSAQISAKIVHRPDVKAELADRLKMIRELQLTLERQDADCNRMIAKTLTESEAERVIASVYPLPGGTKRLVVSGKSAESIKQAAQRAEGKKLASDLTKYEADIERVKLYRDGVLTAFAAYNDDSARIGHGTAWGLFNAFTGYIDHDLAIRGTDMSRALYKSFGAGGDVKSAAYDACVKVALDKLAK